MTRPTTRDRQWPPDAQALREAFFRRMTAPVRDVVSAIPPKSSQPAIFAVGGVVRDLLLDRPTHDLDLVVEGDAIALVRSALPGARVIAHARFGTATVRAGGQRIDIATARSELYGHPGALPRIAAASIDVDLRRRDFSVNAMALRLNGNAELLDPCDGTGDIDQRAVRVLHERSFADDPTRIFRAVRYAIRLGFEIEPRTLALLNEGLQWIRTLSGTRTRRELELLLGEPTAVAALDMAEREGVLRATHAALRWPAHAGAMFERLAARVPRLPLGFALLTAQADADDTKAAAQRLKLRRDEAAAVTALPALRAVAGMLERPGLKPSGATVLFDRYPPAAVAALAATARTAIVREITLRYLEEWRRVRASLTGNDLRAMGVPEGPSIGRALQLLRAARLDGWAATQEDEAALVVRFVQSIRDARGDAQGRDGE